MDFDIINLALVVISILVAIYAALITRQSHLLQQRIADQQGLLDLSELRLKVFNLEAVRDVLILTDFGKYRAHVIPILLKVRNQGKKTANDVNLILRLNKQLTFGGGKNVTMELGGGPKYLKPKKIQETESHELYSISLGDIHPDVGFELDIPAVIQSATIAEKPINTTSSDGIPITMKVRIEFAWVMEILVSHRDSRLYANPIHLRVIDTKGESPEQAMEQYFLQSEKRWAQKLGSLPLVKRLVATLRSLGSRKGKPVVLVYAPSSDLEAGQLPQIGILPHKSTRWTILEEDERGFIATFSMRSGLKFKLKL